MTLPLENFKKFYQNKNNMDISRLDEIYSDRVIFKDPIHEIRGLTKLHDYMDSMYRDLDECRFEYLDELESENSAYIKWNMHYRHPKFGSKLITVRGVSQIQFESKIIFHEDIYDMGALVYEHAPIIGILTRWLKKRIAQASI